MNRHRRLSFRCGGIGWLHLNSGTAVRMQGAWLLLCALTVAVNLQASSKIHYVVLTDNGTVGGEQAVVHGDDGVTTVRFDYKHSLSHTQFDERYRLGADGAYTEYHVTRISEYGAPVDEQFTRTGDRAVWKSTSEHGRTRLSAGQNLQFVPEDILRETVAYAHSRRMRVSGHVPAFLRAQDVIDDGYDEIQHITHVLLNFLVRPDSDTRTLQRFELPAAGVADLNFDSQGVQDFLVSLKEHQVVVDPTLTTFDFLRQRDGDMSQASASIADHMPLDVKRSFTVGIMKIPDGDGARYDRSYLKMIEFVGRMCRAGIPLVAGADALAGFSLQREFELYVQAGLTPAQVLQIATWNGAKYTRTLADRGSITPGKRADLTVIDGDPTKDIADVRKVVLVITQGKLVSPRDIDSAARDCSLRDRRSAHARCCRK
jgi:amidohydrolase family protein